MSHYREMELEEGPPPLPERNYSWSDIEDNDEEYCQSDDELDEPSTTDHQKIYSSVSRGVVRRGGACQ